MDTEVFKNPIVLGVCGGFVSLLFVYLDAKANNKETTVASYAKVFGLVALLIGAVAYFMTDKNLQMIGGGSKIFDQINAVAGGGSGSGSSNVGTFDVDATDVVSDGSSINENLQEITRRVLTSAPNW